jgi:hypothetical protein
MPNDEGMKSETPLSRRGLLHRCTALHQGSDSTIQRFNDFNVANPIRPSSFPTNRVVLAVVGPAAAETVRDIDRSLLLSASRRE